MNFDFETSRVNCIHAYMKENAPTGTEKEKMKRLAEEEAGDIIKEWTGMDFASPTRAAENRTKWKRSVANSCVVTRRPSKVMGKINNKVITLTINATERQN